MKSTEPREVRFPDQPFEQVGAGWLPRYMRFRARVKLQGNAPVVVILQAFRFQVRAFGCGLHSAAVRSEAVLIPSHIGHWLRVGPTCARSVPLSAPLLCTHKRPRRPTSVVL